MNVKFKILWYEDEIAWVQGSGQQRVNDILKQYNLVGDFTVKQANDGSFSDILKNSWDLILMDYKLGGSESGDVVADQIRKGNVMADIAFYSSDLDGLVQTLKERNNLIEGCYFLKRDNREFEDRLREIIKKIIHRSEDAVGLRGLILEHSTDFESRIAELLKSMWDKLDSVQKDNVLRDISKIIENLKNTADERTHDYVNNKDFYGAIDNPSYMPMGGRLKLFDKMLSIITNKDSKFSREYNGRIGYFRNAVGHIKATDELIRVDGQDIRIDGRLFVQKREDINVIDSLLSDVEKHLC